MKMLLLLQLLCAWIFAVVYYSLQISAAQPIFVATGMLLVVLPAMCIAAIWDVKIFTNGTWWQNQVYEWLLLTVITLSITAIFTTGLVLVEYSRISRGLPVSITIQEAAELLHGW